MLGKKKATALVTCALMLGGLVAAATPAGALSPSPLDRITIVTVNLQEGFGDADLRNMREVRVFADRALAQVPYRPDVLLLQEVRAKSANYVATVFSNKTGDRYVVAQNAPRRPFSQNRRTKKIFKANTAVVMNSATMAKVRKGGYITTPTDSDRAGWRAYSRNAHVLLKQRTGSLRLAATSVHIADKFISRGIPMLVKGLDKRYPSTDPNQLEVVGGDFNQVGIDTKTRGRHETKRWWAWLTGKKRFNDSVFNAAQWAGIDAIYVRRGVHDAGGDRHYNWTRVRNDPTRFYSDHMFRWAVVGHDTNAPTDPRNLEASVMNNSNGRYVRLRWDPSSDVETPISEYFVYRSTDGQHWRKIGFWRQTMFADFSAKRGVRYDYKVRALDYTWNKSVPTRISIRA